MHVQEYLKGVNLKECNLLEAGKMFDTFGYALAFPASSADFIAFSQAIVKLKENGDMRRIIKKYGVGAGASGGGDGRLDCTASAEASDSMSIYDIGGLLYMTAILVTIGFAINSWERYTHDKAIVPCLQVGLAGVACAHARTANTRGHRLLARGRAFVIGGHWWACRCTAGCVSVCLVGARALRQRSVSL